MEKRETTSLTEGFLYNRVVRTDLQEDLVESHAHTRFEMYFLVSGECRYFIGNKILRVPANHIILIPGGVMHKAVYMSNSCERILLHFTSDYINPILAPRLYSFFPTYIYAASAETLPLIQDIFENIRREYELADEFSREMIKAHVTSLLTEIVRHSRDSETEPPENASLLADDAVRYLNAHFREDVKLSMMAKRAMVSESNFSRQFKSSTGYGFKEYVNVLRLREAQRMLLNTNLSVCNIAFACGYHDSNYFSTVFKSVHNMSPLAFRRANRRLV